MHIWLTGLVVGGIGGRIRWSKITRLKRGWQRIVPDLSMFLRVFVLYGLWHSRSPNRGIAVLASFGKWFRIFTRKRLVIRKKVFYQCFTYFRFEENWLKFKRAPIWLSSLLNWSILSEMQVSWGMITGVEFELFESMNFLCMNWKNIIMSKRIS